MTFPKRDVLPLLLLVVSLLVSIGSFLFFYSHGLVTKYPDAQAHLLIARRVCDSSSPGFAQLGAVWLPLTHVVSLPLICSDIIMNSPFGPLLAFATFSGMLVLIWRFTHLLSTSWQRVSLRFIGFVLAGLLTIALVKTLETNVFYTTGLAQTILSMFSYCLLGFFLYKLVIELTGGSRGAALVAWMIVMLNPNIIYLQATPMTELPLYCGIMLAMYSFWRLSNEPSNLKWLFWSGTSSIVMTTIRYEGWVLLLLQAVAYGYILLRHRKNISDIISHMSIWAYLSFAGVIGWFVWNTTIFGTPFEFQNGTYSKPSNWVMGTEAAFGNLQKAFLTYSWTAWDTIGPILFIAAAALVIYTFKTGLKKEALPPLMPLIFYPFFVYMLFKGQRPMQALQVEGSIYNARFALVLLLTAAPIIGVATQWRKWTQGLAVFAILASTVFTFHQAGVLTLREPLLAEKSALHEQQVEMASWLQQNYNGETLLMESYGNEQVQFLSQIDLLEVIYEGTYQRWLPVLADPSEYQVEIVIMRGNPTTNSGTVIASLANDLVWQTLRSQQSFHAEYQLVFRNESYEVYRHS